MKQIRTLKLLVCVYLILPFVSCGGVKRINTDMKVVALTFDDGPNPPYTEKLLKVLAEKKVTATFFLIGKQIETHPATARQIIAAGHELGGHSYGWDALAFKKREYVNAQLDQMERAFSNVGVTNLTLFRPPNGILSPGQGKLLEARGLRHISADVVVGDWKAVDAATIRDRVVKKVRPGSIIVLHDGGGDRAATIAAVPLIIDGLKSMGYEFATVSELLALKQ
ncbi:polysaccharide deacetylase family protein [Pontiella sulfatireligans]|uniref:Peptidoglycan-N-acetylglucosamine deacetylase n=1 Tax=Pontiella sulfatireligans TaxID=2750658 RepID=A0A6C2UPH2_9BACT|nr:polysaccharide deacetylase family protein [Pontiella sulfatireligans]VGO21833.1 Peptidoglycan-N-acetylglucosamine deacetylase [Pontiella sulfatireligans]